MTVFNSTHNKCSALISDISPSLLFYLLLRALFQANSHYFQFSSASPSHVFRQDLRILSSVPEKNPGVLPSVAEQNPGFLPSVPKQDLRILPNEPEQDRGILENIEEALGTLSQSNLKTYPFCFRHITYKL